MSIMNTKNITVASYKGPMTGFKTMITVSNKLPYGKGFKQAQITYKNGQMYYIITDGYRYLTVEKPVRNNLKSAINIVEYHVLKGVL